MKLYFKTIQYAQEILVISGIVVLAFFPLVLIFARDTIGSADIQHIYSISHIFLFFVMIVRPLADIFTGVSWLRPLVILRKGAGVLSASIVVSFIIAKIIVDPLGYLSGIVTLPYWSLVDYAVLGHVADISAIILLVTSNNFSKRILGSWWKKVQKLAYVYFYGSALYVYLAYGTHDMLVAIVIVTILTLVAFIKNKRKTQYENKKI